MDEVKTEFQQSSIDIIQTGGQFTLSEIGRWLYHLLFFPGDYMLSLVITYAPQLVATLGLSPLNFGGVLSGVLSVLIWAALFVSVRAARRIIRNTLRAFIDFLKVIRLAIRARLHVARTMLFSLFHRFPPRRTLEDADLSTQFELNDLDLAVLQAEAHLAPGFSLTAPDIAASIRVRPSQAQQILDKLKKLQLITDSFGSMDGFDGYQITQSGRFVVTSSGLLKANVH